MFNFVIVEKTAAETATATWKILHLLIGQMQTCLCFHLFLLGGMRINGLMENARLHFCA